LLFNNKFSDSTKISLTGAIGGPLVIAFLFTILLKKNTKITFALNWTIAVVAHCLLLFIPYEIYTTGWIILLPLVNFFITQTLQVYLKTHLTYSNLTQSKLFLSTIGFILTVATIVVSHNSKLFPAYINHIQFINKTIKLHYPSHIDKEEAMGIANLIYRTGFTEKSDSLDLFLNQNDSCFLIQFAISDTSLLSNPIFITEFKTLELILNNQTETKHPFQVMLTSLFTHQDYPLENHMAPENGVHKRIMSLITRQLNENQSVLYNVSAKEKDIEILIDVISKLKLYFPKSVKIDLLFELINGEYQISFFVNKMNWELEAQRNRLSLFGQYLTQSGIAKPIRIFMLDPSGFQMEVTNSYKLETTN